MNDGLTAREFAKAHDGAHDPGVDKAVARAGEALLRRQHHNGHWVFELEADATISSEYIFLQHYLGQIDLELQARIARYIRTAQGADGRCSMAAI